VRQFDVESAAMIPLSYSFIRDYENCPHKAQHKYVLKDLPPEPMSPELAEGIRVHDLLEQQINGAKDILADVDFDLDRFGPFVMPLMEKGARAEVKLGMALDGRATGFWQGPVWLRGKLDVVVGCSEAALIVDWKTGKVREDPLELEIGALLLKAAQPMLKRIRGYFVWLKELKLGKLHDVSDTEKTFGRVLSVEREMNQEGKEWRKTPNPLCGYCPVKTCEYNRSGK
jgi:hypothetical protein